MSLKYSSSLKQFFFSSHFPRRVCCPYRSKAPFVLCLDIARPVLVVTLSRDRRTLVQRRQATAMRRAQGRKDTKASGGAASQRLRCSQMLMALRSSAALLVWVRKIFWEGIGPVITGNLISIQKDQPRQLITIIFFSSLKKGCF